MRKAFLLFLAKSFTECEQGPDDGCWPPVSEWSALNASLKGKLISNEPVAISCYPGAGFNARQCATINTDLTEQTFVSNSPIALSYPTDSCPPVNLSANPCTIGYSKSKPCTTGNGSGNGPPTGSCTIGDQPRFTVNATEVSDVAAAVNFARNNNIRLVIRDTGHDLLRR